VSINIKGLDKAAVLSSLYNASRQQGMGFMNPQGQNQMTIEQARKELDANPRAYFDYLHGRVMKIDLSTDELREALYDRDNGQGACLRAIDHLLQKAA
jgi:hypothetical protein